MRYRRVFRAGSASSAALVGLAVSFAAAQDPFQVPERATTESSTRPDAKSASKRVEAELVRKSDEEWAKILSPAEYLVTRQKATEPAFTGKYAAGHFQGTFACVCCSAPLFDARAKFDSGTGWPSFWQPVNRRSLQTAWDYSEAEPRVEVMCRRCGAHLGHVFEDGPPPTGLRYCINSVALRLKPPTDDRGAAIQAIGGGMSTVVLNSRAGAILTRAARTPVRRKTDRGQAKGRPRP